MKYNKINYEIIGRFEYGSKYGVISRKAETGYSVDGLEGIAVKKKEGTWYVDHIKTGLGIVTVGCSTRDAAVNEYVEHYKDMVENMDPERMREMAERFNEAIPETVLATYEKINYCSIKQHRFDKVTTRAKNAGCIIKNADDISYQSGGNIDIYGTPEMLKSVNDLINEYKAIDTPDPETVETETTKEQEPATAETITAETVEKMLPGLLVALARRKDNAAAIVYAAIKAGCMSNNQIADYFTTGKMPPYHTFDIWKRGGYTVKKGEHAKFTAYIWKHIDSKKAAEPETDTETAEPVEVGGDFIRKTAYFFGPEQVEKSKPVAELPELPGDVKRETSKGCDWISGNTKPIKDALKAAGFKWSHKNNAWYRRAA